MADGDFHVVSVGRYSVWFIKSEKWNDDYMTATRVDSFLSKQSAIDLAKTLDNEQPTYFTPNHNYGYYIAALARDYIMATYHIPFTDAQKLADFIDSKLNETNCTWIETQNKTFRATMVIDHA